MTSLVVLILTVLFIGALVYDDMRFPSLTEARALTEARGERIWRPSLPRDHTACPTSTRPATARNRRSKIAPSETRISTASIVRPVSLEETNPGKPTPWQAEQTTNASTTRIAQE